MISRKTPSKSVEKSTDEKHDKSPFHATIDLELWKEARDFVAADACFGLYSSVSDIYEELVQLEANN